MVLYKLISMIRLELNGYCRWSCKFGMAVKYHTYTVVTGYNFSKNFAVQILVRQVTGRHLKNLVEFVHSLSYDNNALVSQRFCYRKNLSTVETRDPICKRS